MSQVLSVPYSLHSGSLTLTSTNGNKYRITVDDDGNLISILIPVCPTSVTDIDGNIYQTVIMGEQCWMKENLRTTKDKDGRIIALITTITLPSTATYMGGYIHGQL